MTPRPRRVLFAPETFNLGETTRAVEVATAVRDAGHRVRFLGYSRRFAGHVEAAGFHLDLLDPELTEAEADAMIAADQGRTLRHPFTREMVGRRVESELALIDRWRPDVIVIGTTLTLFISARAAGIPLAYVRPYALSRGHLARMTSVPLVPGSGPAASLVNGVTGRLLRSLVPSLRWKPASFRQVAARYGVPLPARTVEAMRTDLDLIASLTPSLGRAALAPGEVAVGPVYARPPGELPAAVSALAARHRPVVYVGLGSSAGRSLARAVLGQLAPMDIDVVSSAGRYLSDDDRELLPDNVRVYDHLPVHRLAGRIDASVIHGGEGTVQTACASGAPFAGIGLQLEQRVNIEECVRHGNALRFSAHDLRRGRLPGVVDRLLHDPTLRRAARAIQPHAQPVGAANSARAILALADRTSGA